MIVKVELNDIEEDVPDDQFIKLKSPGPYLNVEYYTKKDIEEIIRTYLHGFKEFPLLKKVSTQDFLMLDDWDIDEKNSELVIIPWVIYNMIIYKVESSKNICKVLLFEIEIDGTLWNAAKERREFSDEVNSPVGVLKTHSYNCDLLELNDQYIPQLEKTDYKNFII